ncbi:MAG: hypothetical protein WBB01_15635 [Phormidesmis sp.]
MSGNATPAHIENGYSLGLSSGLTLSQSDVWKLTRAIAAEITSIFKQST